MHACTHIVTAITNKAHCLQQEDLQLLNTWECRLKYFVQSMQNSVYHDFHKSKKSTSYTIRNTPVELTVIHRDLGIMISSNLSWESPSPYILDKVYKKLGLLQCMFSKDITIDSNYTFPSSPFSVIIIFFSIVETLSYKGYSTILAIELDKKSLEPAF